MLLTGSKDILEVTLDDTVQTNQLSYYIVYTEDFIQHNFTASDIDVDDFYARQVVYNQIENVTLPDGVDAEVQPPSGREGPLGL